VGSGPINEVLAFFFLRGLNTPGPIPLFVLAIMPFNGVFGQAFLQL